MFTDFMGTFQHNLDQKNRLAVPTKMRPALGEEFVVCKPLTQEAKCLYLYTLSAFEDLVQRTSRKADDKTRTAVQRIIYNSAAKVEMDGQGRFTLPAEYCTYAELKKTVVVFGAGARIELWNEENYEAEMAKNIEAVGFDFSTIDY